MDGSAVASDARPEDTTVLRPDPSDPLRTPFMGEADFFALGRALAADNPPDLPAYARFSYPARLDANAAAIRRDYFEAQAASRQGAIISPAAEWLLDNHHVVDETFRHVRRDLTRAFYASLPGRQTAQGPVPDMLALAWTYVAQSDSDLRLGRLTEMVEGWQSLRWLKIGEVWAIPALLRFVLLENLRRISGRVAASRVRRQAANALADEIATTPPAAVASRLAIQARGSLDDSFALQMIYRLRDGGDTAYAALDWVERRLAEAGLDSEKITLREHARQSAANVTTGNIIRSLRRIDEINWTDWFESVSGVDRVLRRSSDFTRLDRQTRNDYRNVIERLARRSALDEIAIAERALALAQDGPAQAGGTAEVGHLLIGAERIAFEREVGYRPKLRESALRLWRRAGWLGIFGPGLALTLALTGLTLAALPPALPAALLLALAALVLLPASEAALAFVNFLAVRLVPPARLPAYDYAAGIPAEARTLVVIPALIGDFDSVDELTEQLERHYLANSRGEVWFALLSDWPDSDSEESPQDRQILNHARAAIDGLAARYDHDGGRRFFLLHRRRLWNAHDRIWQGWERKRGKLVELNQLILGQGETTYLAGLGPALPADIRYVVTLDGDTRLPRDAVAKLVGKIAHPVNRPETDPATGLVRRGHAILQPRVTPSLTTGAEASIFQHVFSMGRGLDPYVFTVSDLYQDLLDEGSYTGKGIYDVAAFEAATEGRIPENAVLSHDLLEGTLARAALASDVEVVEDFPTRYDIDASRQHRWARGDWQLLPFLLDRRNGISALGRLKMADNLRRSLVPIAWVAASVAGWLLLPHGMAARFQIALLGLLFLAQLLSVPQSLVPPPGVPLASQLRYAAQEFGAQLREAGLRLFLIVHHAWLMADAILRTLWRLFVSRRRLLEWRTARQVATLGPARARDWWLSMAVSPLFGLGAAAAVALFNPQALHLALVFAAMWVVAPFVAMRISRTLETEDRLNPAPADRAELRRIARTTWRYFETFVTEASNHLPPDNWQEEPLGKLAERTSPTNIGIYLLSVLSARDMGWISTRQAADRIGRTLETLDQLERYRGHFHNWYDTRTLAVLEPRYVSSVDSGNLAGHLLTLASGLRAWGENPTVYQYCDLAGVGDTLAVLRERLAALPDDRRMLRPLRRRLEQLIEGFADSHRKYSAEPQLASIRALNLVVIAADIRKLAADLHLEAGQDASEELLWWAGALAANCDAMVSAVETDRPGLKAFGAQMLAMAEHARRLAFEMDFTFLMAPDKRLLSIGFRTGPQVLDESCYDLLASEARLASLFAIAKGDIPTEHWFRLGRPMALQDGEGMLLSWSGSMFEYLMPPLVMQERLGGILNVSNTAAVRAQIRNGRRLGLPWGVSESAFNARDHEMNYQYYAFGVPALALKRMPATDRVVAPYASLLASQIAPAAAVANLRRLAGLGAFGRYGFVDAVDFTPDRLPEGAKAVPVRNYMAHHHGMSIVAVTNAVLDGIHRDRFHDDPVIKAAELLLQEKAPSTIVPVTRPEQDSRARPDAARIEPAAETLDDPGQARRALAVLSNGRLSAQIASTGAGSLRCDGLAVTRWRPDPARDSDGSFLFLRDLSSGAWWSATAAPRPAPGEWARAILSDHKAEFHKRANGIESRLDVILGREGLAEGRCLTLVNTSAEPRMIEVTSYGEIALDKPEAAAGHPVFSQMFVETEIRGGDTILARRNPREPGERGLQLAHLIAGPAEPRATEAETDRRAFLGRGRDLGTAAAFDPGARLSASQGFTLDPVFALRRRVKLMPGKEARLVFWTVLAEDGPGLDRAIQHYRRSECFEHEERLSWTHSQVQLRHLGTTLEEATLFRRLAAALVWPDRRLAIQDGALHQALHAQSELWPLGISGDRPLFVLRIDDEGDMPVVRKALRMIEYFRARQVAADLVILNERASSYVQDLQTALETVCDLAARIAHIDPAHRVVFPVRRDRMSVATFETLLASARIVLHARNGRLSEQLRRLTAIPAADAARPRVDAPQLLLAPPRPAELASAAPALAFPHEALQFPNGLGGFSADGRSYVVRMTHGQRSPHPWINVIARDDFGFHVSAGGAGYTWAVNSRDYQVTPWSNDPVTNQPGEGFWLRDRATGRILSPFAAASDDPQALHEARHAPGHSLFRVFSRWVEVEALQVLHPDHPAKLTRLRITNRSSRTLDLDVAAMAELVLGNDRARSGPMIRAHWDAATEALVARNPYATSVRGRHTALVCDRPAKGWCLSRSAFLGRNGRIARPAALTGRWPQGAEPEGDPCLALLTGLRLAPGASGEVTFALADAPAETLADVLAEARAEGAAAAGLAAASAEAADFLGRLQVETPDRQLDLMVNTWLPWQALACRIRARSGFYQASGAFGFRDQLQDTAALLLQDPGLARAQILNAAGRQFPEGDVQHWWLPETGAGVRTMISDDVVWLAHITALYVARTGDTALLDHEIAFLEGPTLAPGQHDAFFQPQTSARRASLYDHCVLGLDLAIARQAPGGLPLILGGDWNDGMNRVGIAGRGESVWLGWFLLATLDAVLPLVRARGDEVRAAGYAAHRARLLTALETAGWDGGWYRRGSFDDGTPLGAAGQDECRIDSIAQSWAAISGAADPARVQLALDAALAQLTDEEAGLLKLFTPPFRHGTQDPGYIKAYPPGVRENGGQYTHAAAWMIHALGRSGRGGDALRLWSLINPIAHTAEPQAMARYRVEPYVVAADIYGEGDRRGRGGWTWYTGSAGWLFRALTEGILGLWIDEGHILNVRPALPPHWPGFRARLQHNGRQHEISVTRDGEAVRVAVDGRPLTGGRIDLARPAPAPAPAAEGAPGGA